MKRENAVMTGDTGSAHVLWPWLFVFGAALPILYGALWFVELYLFVIAVALGALVFFGTAAVRMVYLVARAQRPWIDRPAILLVAGEALVHMLAVVLLRTVNWC